VKRTFNRTESHNEHQNRNQERFVKDLTYGMIGGELGMMTLPPVPMMAGPFGIYGFWPGLFIASFIAHVAFGVILGVLAERWVRDQGTIFSLLTERPPSLEEPLRRRA
jgi:hypothetical protein